MSETSSTSAAVVVDGLSKTFRRANERSHTLKERVLRPGRSQETTAQPALDDVSFTVEEGEFFGIVGRNGSGKSTLLKCLAGIYRPDTGSVRMRGRISTFIELGVGFNPDLAARDNVLINGIMLGLTPQEALRRFHRVIEFAELEHAVDLKLKNYSSGMQVRLAFSVMAHVDADILLIDEVLAVGDIAFQQKCFDVFNRLRDEGKTILFVTHDMSAVNRFCDRAMLLEHGEMRLIGSPERVGNHYLEVNFGRDRTAEGQAAEDAEAAGAEVVEHFGTGELRITDAWVNNAAGERVDHLPQGDTATVCVRMAATSDVIEPNVAVLLESDDHVPLFATSSFDHDIDTGVLRAGEEAVFTATLALPFRPGRMFISPWVVRGHELLDRRTRMTSIVLTAVHDTGALVNLEHEVAFERVTATAAEPAS